MRKQIAGVIELLVLVLILPLFLLVQPALFAIDWLEVDLHYAWGNILNIPWDVWSMFEQCWEKIKG
jgi:hypothetical protein